MKRVLNLLIILSLYSLKCIAQTDSTAVRDTHKITVAGYIEGYYTFDIDDPKAQVLQPFFFNYAERNQFSLNLGMLRFSYTDDNHRGHISLMTGTYAQYNLSSEPGILQNIYEAYVGFKLRKHLWLDAGIFPSHIGCESAIGKDNFNLTRSLIAENSPYFETGVKLTYDRGKRWAFSLLVLNGWQNIRETNRDKAIGTHVVFKANEKITLSSCGFAGNEKADTAKQYRLFHDINMVWAPTEKFNMIAAFDIGAEQVPGFDSIGKWNAWHGASLQFKFNVAKKISLALRGEEYWDQNSVIISPISVDGIPKGFSAAGGSFNIDYKPYKNVVWRTEFRYLKSPDTVFRNSGNKLSDTEMTAVTALMIGF